MTSVVEDFKTAASPDKALWDAVGHRFGGQVTKAAIEAGANVNAVDEKGYSVLMHAVRERRWEEMVPILIAAGADVRYVAPDGETPYTICKDKAEDPKSIRYCLNILAGKAGLEKLFEAIRKKDTDAAQRILESGEIIDINLPAQQGGWTAIEQCISENNAVCLDLVLQAGADPNGTRGKRPLISAIKEWHADPIVVRTLLEGGADPDLANDEGLCPLPQAAARGQESIVTLLLEHGADANVNRGQRDTAVHRAAENGHAEIIRILAAHGADFTLLNSDGQPPLETAIVNRHREAFDALIEAGADPLQCRTNGITLIMNAAWVGEAGVIPLLVKRGVPVDAKAEDSGDTALGWAAACGKGETARALISLGASVDIANNDGKTALDLAREKGHIHVERMIEKKIADEVALGLRAEKPVKTPFRLTLRTKNAL